jgi:hypothetical protein
LVGGISEQRTNMTRGAAIADQRHGIAAFHQA